MASSRPLRLAAGWDERFGRMLVVSAVAHVVALGLGLVVAERSGMQPVPLVAYTVELTDPSALGGRVPPGPPAADLSGGPSRPPAPEPKGEAVEPPAPPPEAKAEPKPEPQPEPKAAPPEEPTVRIPEKTKPPEPKPEPPKPEPKKAETAKVEPPKPEPKKPEPKKPEPAKAETPKPAPPKPPVPSSAAHASEAKPGTPTGAENAPARDAYSAAAERWRSRAAGGGLGGTDEGSGPIGSGGEGKGGGGELVGLEFIAYKQQVINTVRASWTNLIGRPGLLAIVTFEIAPDGEVSNPRLTQSSGNAAYDASALRAVQHTARLPPPPPRYAKEFHEFIMRFRSEDPGGQGAG